MGLLFSLCRNKKQRNVVLTELGEFYVTGTRLVEEPSVGKVVDTLKEAADVVQAITQTPLNSPRASTTLRSRHDMSCTESS